VKRYLLGKLNVNLITERSEKQMFVWRQLQPKHIRPDIEKWSFKPISFFIEIKTCIKVHLQNFKISTFWIKRELVKLLPPEGVQNKL
jgi:hypothetical protein